jgi:uncharacterized membrane protein YebE (DUF533 family)
MIDSKTVLDSLIAGHTSPWREAQPNDRQRNFLGQLLERLERGDAGMPGAVLRQSSGRGRNLAGGAKPYGHAMGGSVDAGVQAPTAGVQFEELKRRAQNVIGRNPELAQGAVLTAAGLLLGTQRGRGIAAGLAGLGGLALITGLAYRAFQDQAASPVLEARGDNDTAEKDALLFVRAMVAAAAADRHLDDTERSRLRMALGRLGVGAEGSAWLEREFEKPATVHELAALAGTADKAAQVYAAARLAIDPDTPQEREFLRNLAEQLKLESTVKREIDEGASDTKTTVSPV